MSEEGFSDIAAYYDLVKSHRDYAGEAQAVRALLSKHVPDAQTILEAACGTGTLLAELAEFQRVGVDASQPMLDVARAKLGPDVTLVASRMETMQIRQPHVEAVLCMDGAIGYVRPMDLVGTLAAFNQLLTPGGLLILEPWYTPQEWQPAQIRVTHHRDDTTTVIRIAYGYPDGRIDFHTAVGTSAGIRTFEEHYDFTLHTEEDLLRALGAAGFTDTRKNPTPGFSRGLWTARHP